MQKNFLKYPVEFIDDPFGDDSTIARFIGEHKILLVADQNIVQNVPDLGTKIGAYIAAHHLVLAAAPLVLAGGEHLKLESSPLRIAETCYKAKLTADDFVLVLGGGSLLDVTGWAVAQLKEVPKLVRMPTTPAAMMDGALMDFAYIDLASVKDALGVPSIPSAVFISTAFANTVLDGVWRAGVSEAVRLAATHDKKLLTKFLSLAEAYASRDAATLDQIVRATIELRRKMGPTALGLESAAEFEPKSAWKLPHGYAVSIGTLIELNRLVKSGEVEQKTFDDARTMLKHCGSLDGLYHSRHILPPEVADFW